jgi:hypothetical protein
MKKLKQVKQWVEAFLVEYSFNTLALHALVWLFNGYIFIFLASFLAATWVLNIGTPDDNIAYYLAALIELAGAATFFGIGCWLLRLKNAELQRRAAL